MASTPQNGGAQTRRPRVLLLLYELRMGGSERQALWLAGALRAAGADAGIMGFRPPGVVADKAREAGIPCGSVPLAYPWSRWYTPLYLVRAAIALRRESPCLLLPFTSIPNVYACLLRRLAGARHAVWNQRDEGIGRPILWMESAAAARASGFIANSAGGAGFLAETLGVRAERIAVVPNAVMPPATDAAPGTWRRRAGIEPGSRVACMIGNFRPPKDHDTLLRAWRAASDRLAPTGCRLHLLLAGKEEFPETVDRLQRELGVERIVHRLGAQTDIAGILADCDFACFSSRSEGLPNAVLEPMAAGLAVAATDLPALRESMPAAQHPFLSPQGDFERLAGSIVRLAADPEAARGLGSMNRAHVTEFFAPGKVFRMYTEALRRFGVSCLSDLP